MPRIEKNIILLAVFLVSLNQPLLNAHANLQDDNKGYVQKNDVTENKSATPLMELRLPKLPIHPPKEYIPLFDFAAYGTYSNPDKGKDVWGASVYGSVSPAVKYDDKLYIIPLYNGSYEREKFFVQEEEGGRPYTEIQHHDLSATAKYLLTDKATISPSIFGGWDLNVETRDESWGHGLYDYNEFGSGCDFDYMVYDTPKAQIQMVNGFKWYVRRYPNYHSLLSLATVTSPEEHEKDYNGIGLSTGWQYANLKNASLSIKYLMLMKYYIDKRVVDEDGILERTKRREFTNSVRLKGSYSPSPDKGFQYRYSSEFAYNASNENFYDSRGTATLSDDVFTPKYYNYLSLDARPEISYIFASKKKDKPIAILNGSYSFLMRFYTNRKAQEANSQYTPDEERDFEHVFKTSLEIPLNKNVSWITQYDYTIEQSNTKFEEFYTYSYKMQRVLTGISLTY